MSPGRPYREFVLPPDKIATAWRIGHDRIPRLCPSLRLVQARLGYLTRSFVGDELNLQILDSDAQA
jgi:hypothetical protein